MDVDARIEALEAECERLRARIEQLETAMGLDLLTPLEWGLTGSEMRVFGVLLTREIATKDACMAALYRDVCRDEPELKIIDVFICKIRKKLAAFDVPIETIWGQGYRLSAATKDRVRERLSRGVAG